MKNNKIKPIKKLMIFTIITVMIVSLFAVPAFAFILEIEPSSTMTIPQPLAEYDSLIGGVAVEFDFSDLTNSLAGGGNAIIFDTDDTYFCFVGIIPPGHNLDNINYFECGYIVYNDSSSSFRFYTTSSSSIPNETVYNDANVDEIYLFVSAEGASIWQDEVSGFMDTATYTAYTLVSPTSAPDDPVPPADGEEQGIFAVWSQITQWIVNGLASVSNAFYANGELTLLGTLCLIPLGLGLALLLISIIQKFLHLRG